MSKICPKCVHTSGSDNFCSSCGTRMVNMPCCIQCGTQIYPSEEYCTGCGRSRAEALASKPTTPAAPVKKEEKKKRNWFLKLISR